MKKIKKSNDYENRNKTKGALKKNKPCRFSLDGNHGFLLQFPPYVGLYVKRGHVFDSPELYYEWRDKQDAEEARLARKSVSGWTILCSRLRYWECIFCKKKDMDIEQKPSKKIRNNIWIK